MTERVAPLPATIPLRTPSAVNEPSLPVLHLPPESLLEGLQLVRRFYGIDLDSEDSSASVSEASSSARDPGTASSVDSDGASSGSSANRASSLSQEAESDPQTLPKKLKKAARALLLPRASLALAHAGVVLSVYRLLVGRLRFRPALAKGVLLALVERVKEDFSSTRVCEPILCRAGKTVETESQNENEAVTTIHSSSCSNTSSDVPQATQAGAADGEPLDTWDIDEPEEPASAHISAAQTTSSEAKDDSKLGLSTNPRFDDPTLELLYQLSHELTGVPPAFLPHRIEHSPPEDLVVAATPTTTKNDYGLGNGAVYSALWSRNAAVVLSKQVASLLQACVELTCLALGPRDIPTTLLDESFLARILASESSERGATASEARAIQPESNPRHTELTETKKEEPKALEAPTVPVPAAESPAQAHLIPQARDSYAAKPWSARALTQQEYLDRFIEAQPTQSASGRKPAAAGKGGKSGGGPMTTAALEEASATQITYQDIVDDSISDFYETVYLYDALTGTHIQRKDFSLLYCPVLLPQVKSRANNRMLPRCDVEPSPSPLPPDLAAHFNEYRIMWAVPTTKFRGSVPRNPITAFIQWFKCLSSTINLAESAQDLIRLVYVYAHYLVRWKDSLGQGTRHARDIPFYRRELEQLVSQMSANVKTQIDLAGLNREAAQVLASLGVGGKNSTQRASADSSDSDGSGSSSDTESSSSSSEADSGTSSESSTDNEGESSSSGSDSEDEPDSSQPTEEAKSEPHSQASKDAALKALWHRPLSREALIALDGEACMQTQARKLTRQPNEFDFSNMTGVETFVVPSFTRQSQPKLPKALLARTIESLNRKVTDGRIVARYSSASPDNASYRARVALCYESTAGTDARSQGRSYFLSSCLPSDIILSVFGAYRHEIEDAVTFDTLPKRWNRCILNPSGCDIWSPVQYPFFSTAEAAEQFVAAMALTALHVRFDPTIEALASQLTLVKCPPWAPVQNGTPDPEVTENIFAKPIRAYRFELTTDFHLHLLQPFRRFVEAIISNLNSRLIPLEGAVDADAREVISLIAGAALEVASPPVAISESLLQPKAVPVACSNDETDDTAYPLSASALYERFRDAQARVDDTRKRLRMELPVMKHIEDIRQVIRNNTVFIVSAETGSGKTTQIPRVALECMLDSLMAKRSGTEELPFRWGRIFCAQPRRVTALTTGEYVSKEVGDINCGGTNSIVGYQIRFDNKTTEQTAIIYMTNGILMRRLQSNPTMRGVSCVILDEVHERSMETDFLLVLLRRLMRQCFVDALSRGERHFPSLRLGIMSATLTIEQLKRYFAEISELEYRLYKPTVLQAMQQPPAPAVLQVSGRMYPVRISFLDSLIEGPTPGNDYVLEGSNLLQSPEIGDRTPAETHGILTQIFLRSFRLLNSAPAPGRTTDSDSQEDFIDRYIQTAFGRQGRGVRERVSTCLRDVRQFAETLSHDRRSSVQDPASYMDALLNLLTGGVEASIVNLDLIETVISLIALRRLYLLQQQFQSGTPRHRGSRLEFEPYLSDSLRQAGARRNRRTQEHWSSLPPLQSSSQGVITASGMHVTLGDALSAGMPEAADPLLEETPDQTRAACLLVFLPGISAIRDVFNRIQASTLLGDSRVCSTSILHSSVGPNETRKAFQPNSTSVLRVVLSTNIAETGVTIPDVVCVIDTGCHNESYRGTSTMNYLNRGLGSALNQDLRLVPISRASANQRAGRAGRIRPGHCIRLYSRDFFTEEMDDFGQPELQRRELDGLVTHIVQSHSTLGSPFSLLREALSPPKAGAVVQASLALGISGAFSFAPSERANQTTQPLGLSLSAMGALANTLVVPPRAAKLLLLAVHWGCLEPAVVMVAAMSTNINLSELQINTGENYWLAYLNREDQLRDVWYGKGQVLEEVHNQVPPVNKLSPHLNSNYISLWIAYMKWKFAQEMKLSTKQLHQILNRYQLLGTSLLALDAARHHLLQQLVALDLVPADYPKLTLSRLTQIGNSTDAEVQQLRGLNRNSLSIPMLRALILVGLGDRLALFNPNSFGRAALFQTALRRSQVIATFDDAQVFATLRQNLHVVPGTFQELLGRLSQTAQLGSGPYSIGVGTRHTYLVFKPERKVTTAGYLVYTECGQITTVIKQKTSNSRPRRNRMRPTRETAFVAVVDSVSQQGQAELRMVSVADTFSLAVLAPAPYSLGGRYRQKDVVTPVRSSTVTPFRNDWTLYPIEKAAILPDGAAVRADALTAVVCKYLQIAIQYALTNAPGARKALLKCQHGEMSLKPALFDPESQEGTLMDGEAKSFRDASRFVGGGEHEFNADDDDDEANEEAEMLDEKFSVQETGPVVETCSTIVTSETALTTPDESLCEDMLAYVAKVILDCGVQIY